MNKRLRSWSLVLLAVLIVSAGTLSPRGIPGALSGASAAGHVAPSYRPLTDEAVGLILIVNSGGNTGDADLANTECADNINRCTLRAAIEQANATPGQDGIGFDLGDGGQQTIAPLSELP